MKTKYLIGIGLVGIVSAFYYLRKRTGGLTIIKERMGTKPEMGKVFDVIEKSTGKIKKVIFDKEGEKTTVKVKPTGKRFGLIPAPKITGESKMDYWHRVLLENPKRMIPAWYRKNFPAETKVIEARR